MSRASPSSEPRVFTDEGTLKAAEAKLPYLKELGVTIVYLVPVMKMDEDMDRGFWSPRQIRSGFNNPKNQYRIADYFHVDAEYGTDQDLVWMFALDGVPMLFTGNEMADADERHSMFGRTPMNWTQLEREPRQSRHALVRQLADMRRTHSVFTDVNGFDGLTWLDTTAPESVTAFVRRNGRDTVLVVQNWTDKLVKCEVSFTMPKAAVPWYLADDETDRDVRGTVSAKPHLAHSAEFSSGKAFALGPWGFWISEVKE